MCLARPSTPSREQLSAVEGRAVADLGFLVDSVWRSQAFGPLEWLMSSCVYQSVHFIFPGRDMVCLCVRACVLVCLFGWLVCLFVR